MAKFFNYSNFKRYKNDLQVDRNDPMDKFLEHVVAVANTFPRESAAIGCLTINDLIQAGNVGLVEAWKKVDWDRIEDSPNPDGELWSFLKIRIKFAIRREIDYVSNMIKIPRRDLENARANLKAHDKILVNIFPRFFDNTAYVDPEVVPWRSVVLEDIILDELNKVERNTDNINMLLLFYGIGFDRMSMKELAEKYSKEVNTVAQIIKRTRNKLKTNEFEKIIENFYENQYSNGNLW